MYEGTSPLTKSRSEGVPARDWISVRISVLLRAIAGEAKRTMMTSPMPANLVRVFIAYASK
jgi:hypothetical protein